MPSSLRRVGTVGMAGLVYHIPAAAHEDFAPLEVLAAMLDAEPSGALYKALVETKKASSVSSYAYPLHDPGVFEVEAQVDKSITPEAVRDALIDVMEKLGEAKTPRPRWSGPRPSWHGCSSWQMSNSNGLARGAERVAGPRRLAAVLRQPRRRGQGDGRPT